MSGCTHQDTVQQSYTIHPLMLLPGIDDLHQSKLDIYKYIYIYIYDENSLCNCNTTNIQLQYNCKATIIQLQYNICVS